MASPFKLASGNWVRFDRYEIRDRCIAPVAGARMHIYDPWKLKERPYQSLAQIITGPECLTLPAEQPELVAAILDWCNRFGLLGILLHRLLMVSLWPRWRRIETATKETVLEETQETYVRLSGAWLTQSTGFSRISTDVSRLGTPLTKEEIPPARKPAALVMDLGGSVISEEDLDQPFGRPNTLADHFPDVPYAQRATYPYPNPVSDDFWRLYGEPIWGFVNAGWLLKNSLDAICNPADAQAPRRGALRLGQLASCGGPTLERQKDGSFRQRWLAATLLSSMAHMAMDDLTGGRLHQCQTCHDLFLSSAYQAGYCSPTCRHTMQKRRHRGRKQKQLRRRKER